MSCDCSSVAGGGISCLALNMLWVLKVPLSGEYLKVALVRIQNQNENVDIVHIH